MTSDKLERAKRDVVIANRILAMHDVVDAYGHVAIRHPDDPDKFLISRSLAPETGDARGHQVVGLDGKVIGDDRPAYGSGSFTPRSSDPPRTQLLRPRALRIDSALQHHKEPLRAVVNGLGSRFRRPRLGHRRSVRRPHQLDGQQHGPGSRPRQEARKEQRRPCAGTVCGGGAHALRPSTCAWCCRRTRASCWKRCGWATSPISR